MGYEEALRSGFRAAEKFGADTVITFDADEQHDPNVLLEIVCSLQKDKADVVICTRPKAARIAEFLFNRYVGYRYGVADILCGLKGYQMDLYRRLGHFSKYESIGTELAIFGLRNCAFVKVISIDISDRIDNPRFATNLVANIKIFRALIYTATKDFFSFWLYRQ